ncbi:MAG: hypothetical protein LEGION0403_FIIPPAGN_02663 [Legionella sp.]|uniref:hypothetical protein n=1 Tax=Legionella sp. TaxID=459 RepID=UPI003D111A91
MTLLPWDSVDSFTVFEQEVSKQFKNRIKDIAIDKKILPASEEAQLDYLASDGYTSKKEPGASDSLETKESCLIHFISPNANYSWRELFPSTNDDTNIELWKHFNDSYEKRLCSIGFEDWPGALTVRGGMIEIQKGECVSLNAARDAYERYKEKKERIEGVTGLRR